MYSAFKKSSFLLFFLTVLIFSLFSQNSAHEAAPLSDTPFWRQALGGQVLSLPSVQAESAVVALDGGSIKAYSTGGTPLWTYSARGRISPFVSRSREGTSYLSRTNGILIAVNRAGRELWRYNMGVPLSAKVIPGWDGRLFAPADKKLFCFTASGTLLWTKSFDHSILIPPKLSQTGSIIFSLSNNDVYEIDPFGNSKVWQISQVPASLLSIGDTGKSHQIIAVHANGSLEILGDYQEWFIPSSAGNPSLVLPSLPGKPKASASQKNFIASVLEDGRIVYLSLQERKIIWTGETHIREFIKNGGRPDSEAEIIIDERGIYILSKNGASGFSFTGSRLWFTLIQNAASIPAFGDDGVLYSGGRDWILYAYKIEDRTLPKGGLFGPSPLGSYGLGTPRQSLMPQVPLFSYELQSYLDSIQAAVNAGKVGENEPAWTTFLLNLSAGQEHITHRINAIKILGQIGSQETISWLVNIFRYETEPLVRAAAASAIGKIGVDPQGIAIQSFLYVLIPETIKDEQILSAIIKASGEISRFSGPPLSQTGIRILNLLSSDNQPSGIRRQAQKELASLK